MAASFSIARNSRALPAVAAALLVARSAGADGLAVEPAEVVLVGASARQQVAVSQPLPDGSARDLTASSRYAVEPAGLAVVGEDGAIRPAAAGSGVLRVEAGGQTAEVPLRVEAPDVVRPVSFRRDIAALLTKSGCNMGACHGNLNGKGGFRLSLRGEDPSADLASLTRDAFGRRVDPNRPGASLAYLKPTGLVQHEGGRRFAPDAAEAVALRSWIAAGAVDDAEESPNLVRLTVWPAERRIAAPGLSQQLLVRAEFADGTTRDVTGQAAFDASDPTRAAVTPGGRVEVKSPGEVAIAVRYLGGRGVSRLAFVADRPDFAWRGPPERNVLDARVFAKLKAIKVHPSRPIDDAAFLRRATLDAIGLLPTAEEARAFLADPDPSKRDKLVDRLLTRPEFADFWALKWADLLRNEEKTMGEKGVWVLQRWLRDQVAADLPLDEFARRIVTAGGSTWRNPPASFHRTNRDPSAAAEAIGQVFLGVRLQCARCHNHPFDAWTQDDYYGLAAFFGNLKRKQINNIRSDKFDLREINGDEVIYAEGPAKVVQPRTGETLAPKPPGGPSGAKDLEGLADWLTRDNPQFARNLANRVWFHLMGRGIVEPVDDFRDSNPPANPELLDALTAEFVAGGMRLKPLVALVMKSSTYALGAEPDATNAGDEANFARAAVRLLPAETLLDALGQALGHPEVYAKAPAGTRAAQLAGVRDGGDFLKVFGKPDRLLTCECERSDATTLAQAFQLLNGEAVRRKLEAPDNRIGRALAAGLPDPEILSDLYLASLSREPNAEERALALAHVAKSSDRRKAWEDVAWAVLNSKEFLLRH